MVTNLFAILLRLLQLLRDNDVRDKVVIVTRWYGGTHLGPQRFNHIVETGRRALYPHIHPQDIPPSKPSQFAKDFPRLSTTSQPKQIPPIPPGTQARMQTSAVQQSTPPMMDFRPSSPPQQVPPREWGRYPQMYSSSTRNPAHPTYYMMPPPAFTSAPIHNPSVQPPWQPWASARR